MIVCIGRYGMLACLLIASSQLVAQQPTAQKAPTAVSPLEKFPKIVAVVNGQTITRDRLAQEVMKRYSAIVLDNLLNKHLILQACQAKGIRITQADVNDEIARVAGKVGVNTKLFLETLEKERDITPEQYASEIIWPMLALRALAADKIQVAPEEIEQIIQSEYGPKVQVRMIAVSQLAQAEQLHAQATQAPETFRRLAKEYSEDAPSAAVEGLLPPIRKYSGDDQLERVAFQLQPGEISPIFQIGEMHVFLQCVRHLEPSMPSPEFLPLIRQRISDQLRDRRLAQAAEGIFQSLQANSEVVMILGNAELEKKYPGVAAYINRQPIPMDHLAAECIARHGKEILRGEINRLLLTMALKQANKQITDQDIHAEIAKAADMAGYIRSDGSPDVDGWLKSIEQEEGATVELYVSDAVWPSVALKKLVEDTVEVTDEDMQKGFVANYGPRAEVLAIVCSNQRTAQDVFREARQNLNEQHFGELAAKYSVEPVSRANFGKIPPIRRFGGNPVLEDAAFSLQPGEMSGVIAWGDQYAILYKQGETKPIVNDIDAVREELYSELFEKKLRAAMHQRLEALLENSQIDNYLEGTSQPGRVATASGTTSR